MDSPSGSSCQSSTEVNLLATDIIGIEATDVSSLLEQFEEASQSSEENVSVNLCTAGTVQSPVTVFQETTQTRDSVNNGTTLVSKTESPSKAVLGKLKAGMKRKAAILLPMGVPSGRGRGKAVAISPHCSSPKLQKILSKNSPVAANSSAVVSQVSAEKEGRMSTPPSEASCNQISSTYYSEIMDHDYCQNFPHELSLQTTTEEIQKTIESTQTKLQNTGDNSACTSEILQLDDSTSSISDACASISEEQTTNVVQLSENLAPLKQKLSHKDYKHRKRNYRQKDNGTDSVSEEKFFDKIPSYFTTLSLPAKPPKRDNKKGIEGISCGITVADFIEREISPTVSSTSGVYNKLPAYHNCFVNSTKYDESSNSSATPELQEVRVQKAKYPWDQLRDKINRDSTPSRSQSPLLLLDTRCESKSREISRSRSQSRSRSKSPPRRYRLSCSSDSSCSSRSPSRYRSRSRSRSQRRRRSHRRDRHERGHSYSSYSSYSSDSDWSSRSRSRSRSYSRSRSRQRSYSGSSHRYRSTSRSPDRHGRYSSRSRRDHSYERRKKERQQRREEEKRKQIEERRIVYVGKIPDTYTRRELRRRFERFGEIEETSVHFRESGDNYGFVTYAYTCDAYAAIEHGNKMEGEQVFDLCFGGRREFCSTDYADLDGQMEEEEEYSCVSTKSAVLDFDQLLQEAKRKLQK